MCSAAAVLTRSSSSTVGLVEAESGNGSDSCPILFDDYSDSSDLSLRRPGRGTEMDARLRRGGRGAQLPASRATAVRRAARGQPTDHQPGAGARGQAVRPEQPLGPAHRRRGRFPGAVPARPCGRWTTPVTTPATRAPASTARSGSASTRASPPTTWCRSCGCCAATTPTSSSSSTTPARTPDILKLLREDRLDIGLVGGPVTGAGLATHAISTTRLGVLLHETHPLAGAGSVPVARARRPST